MNAAWGEAFRRGRTRRLAVALAPVFAAGIFLAWFASALSVFILFLWKSIVVGSVLTATASYALWHWGGRWFEKERTAAATEGIGVRAEIVTGHGGKLVLSWVVVLILNCGIAFWSALPHPPSDTSMRIRFVWHRADLERLAKMASEDRDMDRIAPDFRSPAKGGISAARWTEYRRLFRRAGIDDGFSRWSPEGDPLLLVWTWGLVTGGSSVGFVHCERPPESCFGGQESGRVDDQGVGYRFRRLAPDWYIVEEWD